MQPSMPGGGPTSTLILFSTGGPVGPHDRAGRFPSRTTQLADGTGHSLFRPSGKLNDDDATRLHATPFQPFVGPAAAAEAFLVARNTGTIVQSVEGIAAMADHHTLIASDFVARVDTEATVGMSDQIGFDPKGGVGFQTKAARKPLTVGLMMRTKGAVHSAELTTTSLQEGVDEFRVDPASSDVIFRHTSTPVPFRLRLSSLQSGATAAIFDSGPLQVGANETATFSPANWGRLDAVTMTVHDPRGGERRSIVENHIKIASLGRIVALDVDDMVAKRPRARSLEIVSRLDRLPQDSQVAIVWTVRQAGRIVAQENRTLPETKLHYGLRRDRFIFQAPGPGHYTLRADLVIVIMQGVIQSARSSTRSASLVVQ
jgi:hypothetical protein